MTITTLKYDYDYLIFNMIMITFQYDYDNFSI